MPATDHEMPYRPSPHFAASPWSNCGKFQAPPDQARPSDVKAFSHALFRKSTCAAAAAVPASPRHESCQRIVDRQPPTGCPALQSHFNGGSDPWATMIRDKATMAKGLALRPGSTAANVKAPTLNTGFYRLIRCSRSFGPAKIQSRQLRHLPFISKCSSRSRNDFRACGCELTTAV